MSTHRQDEESYNTWISTKVAKLSRPKLDCGCPTSDGQATAGHIWCNRIACLDHAEDAHDCSAYGGVESGIEKVSEPVGVDTFAPIPDGRSWLDQQHEADRQRLALGPDDAPTHEEIQRFWMNETVTSDRPFRCRGCRLWIAQDVKLCGPCSALPPCSAERLRADWGLVLCFRPGGHDGQHETVEGRCWMDPPSRDETPRAGGWSEFAATIGYDDQPLAEVHAADPRPMETRSLECSRSRPMCSGCDGAAAWGSGPCLHECHEASQVEPLRPADVADRRRSLECAALGLEHGDCSGESADQLSGCLCDCHILKRPWWKRLFQ